MKVRNVIKNNSSLKFIVSYPYKFVFSLNIGVKFFFR